MKILLDENIDVRFKTFFPANIYEVYTVRDMQWNGIKNGILLRLLSEHNFDCWIIVDKICHISKTLIICHVPL